VRTPPELDYLWGVGLLVVLGGVVGVVGSAFSDSSRLPASDSGTAYNLFAQGGARDDLAQLGSARFTSRKAAPDTWA
jgi:hypothetical protein